MPRLKLIVAAGTLAVLLASPAALRPAAHHLAGRSTVYAPNGVVATSQPLASAAGLEVLRHGGNAIDAAVTAAAVLSVTEPQMTGIGGDMFALVWLAKEQKLVALNASGRAGSLMTRETLLARGFQPRIAAGRHVGHGTGALAGWDMLLRTHGRRTLARRCSPRSPTRATAFRSRRSSPRSGRRDGLPGARLRGRRHLSARRTRAEGGRVVPEPRLRAHAPGDRRARHRHLLRRRARPAHRGAARGTGRVPHARRPQEERTGLGDADLGAVSGYRVWELPPNNQGVAALEMLRILEPYDLKAMGHNSAPYLHHLIEAKKLAYADLDRFVGDAEHLDMPAAAMLTDEFIAERRSHLDPSRAAGAGGPGTASHAERDDLPHRRRRRGEHGVVHQLELRLLRSGIVVPGTGFALHNRGAGFTLTPGDRTPSRRGSGRSTP